MSLARTDGKKLLLCPEIFHSWSINVWGFLTQALVANLPGWLSYVRLQMEGTDSPHPPPGSSSHDIQSCHWSVNRLPPSCFSLWIILFPNRTITSSSWLCKTSILWDLGGSKQLSTIQNSLRVHLQWRISSFFANKHYYNHFIKPRQRELPGAS